jgi:hypothetical protein
MDFAAGGLNFLPERRTMRAIMESGAAMRQRQA